MKSFALTALALGLLGIACAQPTEGSGASNDAVTAGDTSIPYIACQEAFIDHGAEVVFYRAPGAAIDVTKAVLSQVTFSGTDVVAEMAVCRAFPEPTGPVIPDLALRTHSCNDVLFRDGHSVDLIQGGLSGEPTILLKKQDSGGTLQPVDKEFRCSYVQEANVCPTHKIGFSQATGCQNDGSFEFCVAKADTALQSRIKAVAPSVRFASVGGRARCNVTTELLGTFPTDQAVCAANDSALTDDGWAKACAIASEPGVRKLVPTVFE